MAKFIVLIPVVALVCETREAASCDGIRTTTVFFVLKDAKAIPNRGPWVYMNIEGEFIDVRGHQARKGDIKKQVEEDLFVKKGNFVLHVVILYPKDTDAKTIRDSLERLRDECPPRGITRIYVHIPGS